MTKMNKASCLLFIYFVFLANLFGLPLFHHISMYVQYLCIIIIFLMYLVNRNKINNEGDPIAKLIPFLFFIPYLSGISRYVVEGGVPIYRHVIFFSSIWLVYYLYKVYNISETTIVKTLCLVGYLIFFIQFLQVLFPDYAIFGTYNEDDSILVGDVAEIRNGIHRFRVGSHCVTLFCLYYYWQRLLNNFSKINFICFIIFIASLYMHLTRQAMFSAAITLSISLFLVGDAKQRKRRLIIIVVALIIMVFGGLTLLEKTFEDMFLETENQINSEDYVRYLSYQYFGSHIFTSPMTMLCGNGFQDELNILSENEGLYPSDVGFVGEAYYYGLLWIILWIYTLWLLLYKYMKMIPLNYKLYVFGTILYSWGMFPYAFPDGMFVWASLLYIASLYVNRRTIRV